MLCIIFWLLLFYFVKQKKHVSLLMAIILRRRDTGIPGYRDYKFRKRILTHFFVLLRKYLFLENHCFNHGNRGKIVCPIKTPWPSFLFGILFLSYFLSKILSGFYRAKQFYYVKLRALFYKVNMI